MSMENKQALSDEEMDKVSGGESEKYDGVMDIKVWLTYRCNITYGGRLGTQVGCGREFQLDHFPTECPYCGSTNIEAVE